MVGESRIGAISQDIEGNSSYKWANLIGIRKHFKQMVKENK